MTRFLRNFKMRFRLRGNVFCQKYYNPALNGEKIQSDKSKVFLYIGKLKYFV